MQRALFIRAEWDDEASVWAARSDDAPGLATEADTLEALPQVGRPGALTSGSQGMPECWRYPFEQLARKSPVAHGIHMLMGSSFTPELIRPLREAGCKFERPGKGDHGTLFPPIPGVRFPVDHRVKSRHTANAVLKQAGLPRKG